MTAHPRMDDDGDPVVIGVRRLALAFPGAHEVAAHGRPTFRTRKVFAYVGGSVRGATTSDRRDHAVILLLPAQERKAVLADPRGFDPAYLGPFGWTGLDLDRRGPDGEPTSWRELAELLDSSFRESAGKPSLAELDALVAAGTDPVTTAPAGAVELA